MEHTTKSILLIAFFFGIMIAIGLLANYNQGITGTAISRTIACENDSDCSDKIGETTDICRNPGTEYSICINKIDK